MPQSARHAGPPGQVPLSAQHAGHAGPVRQCAVEPTQHALLAPEAGSGHRQGYRQGVRLLIPSRFCGPPESGNGGWTSGHLATFMPPATASSPGSTAPPSAITVRLRTPPPLDVPMHVVEVDGGVDLLDGDVLVAQARPSAPLSREGIPAPVPFAVASAAAASYDGLRDHPFPTCYSCGTAREEGDALCLRPGRVDEAGEHAAAWVPRASTTEDVWAALDCPGAWALGVGGRPMVLGTMTAQVSALPEVGAEHVVMAWVIGSEGRKHRCGTALFAGERLLAHAEATWIMVDPRAVRPATGAR